MCLKTYKVKLLKAQGSRFSCTNCSAHLLSNQNISMDDQLSSFKVVKLGDDNFYIWKQRIELVLAYRELDHHISDDPPAELDDTFTSWKRGDARARAIIGLSLSDEHLEHVRDVKTAKEMWKCILNVFQRHTLLNKLAARRNFYTVTMKHGEKMLNYINRIRQLASTLKSMDAHVEDAEVAMTILNGLPQQYSNLIVALDALGSDQAFTVDFVKSRLLQEEQRIRDRRDTSSSIVKSEASALVNSGGSQYNLKGRRGTNRVFKCNHCGKRGHIAPKCWDLHPDQAPWANNKTNHSTAVVSNADKAQPQNEALVCLMADVESNASANNKQSSYMWYIDSGASSHMTFDIHHFTHYKRIQPCHVEIGDKSNVQAVGTGQVALTILVNGRPKTCILSDVLHIPNLGYNLISVSAMDAKNIKTSFSNGTCNISKNGRVLAQGFRNGGLYALHTVVSDQPRNVAAIANLELWHARLGHVHTEGIKRMVNKCVVDGISFKDSSIPQVCDACVKGKIHCHPIPKHSDTRSAALLDLVHSDVCGPLQVPSMGGSRYFVTFIDDYSKWAVVYTMKVKSECSSWFMKYQAMIERETGRKIKVLRSDRGGEYISNTLHEHFVQNGIQHQFSAPYTPQQNGVAERYNRTVMELVRAMLHHKNVHKKYWAEALSTACYIRNRVTSRGIPSNTTPYEMFKGAKPKLSHLRVFGSRCWYAVPRELVRKLDSRANEAILLGYATQSKAYKLWDVENQKIVISRDVVFDEENKRAVNKVRRTSSADNVNIQSEPDSEEHTSSTTDSSSEPGGVPDIDSESNNDHNGSQSANNSSDTPHNTPTTAEAPRRSTRVRKAPSAWWKATAAIVCDPAPETFLAAVRSSDCSS